MITDEDINKLASFMDWHMTREFIDGEYIICWTSEDGESIPIDFWNPDSDMSDAWMIVEKVKSLGKPKRLEFEGWIALELKWQLPPSDEFTVQVNFFDLNPEIICKAALKLIRS